MSGNQRSDCPPWLAAAPTLFRSYRDTIRVLDEAREALDGLSIVRKLAETVYVCGSLGRLEMHAESDVDCVVVTRAPLDAPEAAELMNSIYATFSRLGLRTPKADGIYRSPVTRGELLDPGLRGSLNESPAVFGKRIQILLDARSVYGLSGFQRLRSDVIGWYAAGSVERNPNKSWTFLINEVARYLHSYASWQQFKLSRSEDDSWQLRQLKFRSSRLLTMGAMLMLLGACDQRRDKLEWLEAQLDDTPLNRLFNLMDASHRSQ